MAKVVITISDADPTEADRNNVLLNVTFDPPAEKDQLATPAQQFERELLDLHRQLAASAKEIEGE